MSVGTLRLMLHVSTAAALAMGGTAAFAQAAPPASGPVAQADSSPSSDIIVTARKRQESLLNVPVVETVVPAATIQRLGTNDVKDLAKLAPGLLTGTAVLSIGQLISIRGVGTSSFDPGIDQSVSLNIDGMSLGQGLAFSSGMFDVGQIEVLKGPQALFFGKSSPGGVISIRTADPTDKFEVIGRFGYETEAMQKRGELIVSGPITDGLKARLAAMYSATQGYYYNDAIPAPGTGALAPADSREGRSRDYQIRGTLLWDRDPKFTARLKLNLVHDNTHNAETFQMTSCPNGITAPLGIPFLGGGENCVKDRVSRIVDMNPANFPGIPSQTPFVKILQRYGTLELNYRPVEDLTATSVTSYYNLHSASLLNTSNTTFAGPAFAVTNPHFRRHDLTQEVRLNSDYSTPFNFTLGGFYQDGYVYDFVHLAGNSAYGLPATLADGYSSFTIKTYSLFGQARYKILSNLELAAGVRWTDETRKETQTFFGTFVNPPVPRIHSSPLSPEATLTYKPSDDVTVFGSYKRGAKSGSFSIATPAKNPPIDNSFNDEKVEGFEGGVKARLADRQLNISLTGYRYTYTGLQVGAIEPTVGAVPTIRTVNAGKGRSYGAEFEAHFRPRALQGLSLDGTLAYNHTRFLQLNNVPCYGGQTIAMGCNQQFTPVAAGGSTVGATTVNGVPGFYFAQDGTGLPFIRAPLWQSTFGFTYEMPVGRSMKLIFANSNLYSSRYLTELGDRSDYYQGSYVKTDLSLTLQGPRDRWEVAVIAKNVTQKYTTGSCSNSNFQGGLLGGQVTGGTVSGPGGIDTVGCYMDPGRELWFRLTLKPFN